MSDWVCDECGEVFPSSGHLGAHVAGKHSDGGFPERVEDQELIDDIKTVASQIDSPPTAREMAEKGTYSHKVCMNRFGSWNDALREAGFEPTNQNNIPWENLIAEIDRLAEKFGRPPSSTEVNQLGRFSRDVYFANFGDWAAALEEAGYERPTSYVDSHGRLPFGTNWAEQREKALKRDDYRCQSPRCSVTREEHLNRSNRDLHVHHIMPRKYFISNDGNLREECANALDNLITLCAEHHQFWEMLSPLRPDVR